MQPDPAPRAEVRSALSPFPPPPEAADAVTTTTDRTSPAARVVAAAAVIGGWLAVAVLSWPGTAGQHRHDPGPAAEGPTLAAVEPLGIGPITFFNTSCGPCHGDYGMLLREELTADLAGWEDVRGVIRGMVIGQARTTLPDREIDALAAYRMSLLDGSPFLALTGVEAGELRGEVTPGATVEVVTVDSVRAATVDGHSWSAAVPLAQGPITIRATLGGRTTALAIPGVPFSHMAADSSR